MAKHRKKSAVSKADKGVIYAPRAKPPEAGSKTLAALVVGESDPIEPKILEALEESLERDEKIKFIAPAYADGHALICLTDQRLLLSRKWYHGGKKEVPYTTIEAIHFEKGPYFEGIIEIQSALGTLKLTNFSPEAFDKVLRFLEKQVTSAQPILIASDSKVKSDEYHSFRLEKEKEPKKSRRNATWQVVGLLLLLFYLGPKALGLFEGEQSKPLSKETAPAATSCSRPEINRDNLTILINEYRLQSKVPELASDVGLETFAERRAYEMYETKKFTHESKYGDYIQWRKSFSKAPWTYVLIKTPGKAGDQPYELYSFARLAEELYQSSPGDNACDVVNGWKSSPTHNSGLIDPAFKGMGIGVAGEYVALQLGSEPESGATSYSGAQGGTYSSPPQQQAPQQQLPRLRFKCTLAPVGLDGRLGCLWGVERY